MRVARFDYSPGLGGNLVTGHGGILLVTGVQKQFEIKAAIQVHRMVWTESAWTSISKAFVTKSDSAHVGAITAQRLLVGYGGRELCAA